MKFSSVLLLIVLLAACASDCERDATRIDCEDLEREHLLMLASDNTIQFFIPSVVLVDDPNNSVFLFGYKFKDSLLNQVDIEPHSLSFDILTEKDESVYSTQSIQFFPEASYISLWDGLNDVFFGKGKFRYRGQIIFNDNTSVTLGGTVIIADCGDWVACEVGCCDTSNCQWPHNWIDPRDPEDFSIKICN